MCTPIFITALFTIAKMWKQPKCPSTDEWVKKVSYTHTHTHTHTHTGILLSHKNDEMLPFATTRMDLDYIMLNEISQMEKEKYYMISLLCEI